MYKAIKATFITSIILIIASIVTMITAIWVWSDTNADAQELSNKLGYTGMIVFFVAIIGAIISGAAITIADVDD